MTCYCLEGICKVMFLEITTFVFRGIKAGLKRIKETVNAELFVNM